MSKPVIAALILLFLPHAAQAAAPRTARGHAPLIVKKVSTQKKVVALTFDDGPSPQATPLLLEYLKAQNIRATFFPIGQEAVKYPALIAREAEEGHEIGNHGMHHKSLSRISEADVKEEIDDGAAALVKAGAPTPALYRIAKAHASRTAYRVLADRGYTVVGWSVESRDYQRRPAEALVKDIMKQVRPGSIIILHDGPAKRSATLSAVRTVVGRLRADGYRFTTVSGLLREAAKAPLKKTA